MAAVAPPPLKSTLEFWASSDSAIYRADSPEPMTHIMPYQYPPPPGHNGAEIDGTPSTYYSAHQQPPSGVDERERRDPYSDSMNPRHSTSTQGGRAHEGHEPSSHLPPLQDATSDQNALSLAAAEKRRNKLGYHRTSVACGHCRRRKIRCIPSPADVRGRCVNCIRLKKECSFFPVDQQPAPDTKQRSGSRSSVGPKLASASSSPALQNGMPAEMHAQQGYSQMGMPSIHAMAAPMRPPGTESFSPESKMPTHGSYGQSGMTNWMAADANPSSSKANDMSWRYPAESPITPATPAFSPYPGQASQASWSASVSGDPSGREDMSWPGYQAPPARSLSYGSEHHQQYPPMSQMGSHPGRPYAPPITTTIPGIETVPGTTMDHQVALSAGAVASPGYQTWPQYQYAKPGDGYSSWYGEAGQGVESSEQAPPGAAMYYAER